MEQAVILAGGLGERLRPLTNAIPKPLVPVANKPFIAHVIEDLRLKGISNFLLLTGYRGDLIAKYFENDRTVQCMRTPDYFSKSERILHAESEIQKEFLLLYGDNLIPENFQYDESEESDIRFTLTGKSPGNIEFSAKSRNVNYFSERRSDLSHVELGYITVKKIPFFTALHEAKTLEDVFCALSRNNRATALCIQGPYFSISDPIRLQSSENAIQGKKIVLIDRDGVINRRMPKGEYVTNTEECIFLEKNLEGMKKLSEKGYAFVIVSNQAGVARGCISASQLKDVNEYILHRMRQSGIEILDFFICMHGWEENCLCRKPKPGMLLEAARKYEIFLRKAVYIGDDKRDVQAALIANCNPIFIGSGEELEDLKEKIYCAENVNMAVNEIIKIYEGNK